MATSRTQTHEPTKIYFTRSEAMEILDCTRSWLEGRWKVLGFKEGGRTHRRYSVAELNKLLEERNKTNGFDRTAYMRDYMANRRKNDSLQK